MSQELLQLQEQQEEQKSKEKLTTEQRSRMISRGWEFMIRDIQEKRKEQLLLGLGTIMPTGPE